MSLDQLTVITTNLQAPANFDDQFYGVIDRLKAQKAVPQDLFIRDVPFFNLGTISKESQLKELYQDVNDPSVYRSLMKNIISMPEEKSPELLARRLSAMQVMSFGQIILYKVLPCPEKNCPNRPREVATHNQYKDYEYQCPFYHHDKDFRRLVLTENIDDEFIYKANYSEEAKKNGNIEKREKCALNYFESMFHPLYYKMFRCKREYCNLSQYCPFFHSEDEKKTWDKTFSNYVRKDRISYVKDKQKYYETSGIMNSEGKPQIKKVNHNNNGVRTNFSKTPNPNNFRKANGKQMKTPYAVKRQEESPKTPGTAGSWRSNLLRSNDKRFDGEIQSAGFRKDSGESFDEVHSPMSSGLFNNFANRIC